MKQRLFRMHRRVLTPRIIVIREKVAECQINPMAALCTSTAVYLYIPTTSIISDA